MASRNDAFDIHWVPPTEAEMKIIEARRERSDKISKLMGDYLLKGYKMLGINCRDCETILLQDRHGALYCVACKELDSDTDKDNPLINQTAALSQVREQQLVTSRQVDDYQDPVTSQVPEIQSMLPDGHTDILPGINTENKRRKTSKILTKENMSEDIHYSVAEILQSKLNWAAKELSDTSSVEYSIRLCALIKSCAEAIQTCQQTHTT